MNKTVLIKRIENLCKERNITMNTAFLESGVGKNFKSNLKTANPTLGKLTLLALYFGVSREYLTGESNERGGGITSPVKRRSVPILGSVACGAPIFAEESYEGYADVASDTKIDFCLYAKGDSMIDAGIRDGSVIQIRHRRKGHDHGDRHGYHHDKGRSRIVQKEEKQYRSQEQSAGS